MNEETKTLFRTLTQLPGAPGNEHQVRSFMKRELAKYADDIVQDRLGSVFGVRRGAEDAPTVMVAVVVEFPGMSATSPSPKPPRWPFRPLSRGAPSHSDH